jgi:NAD(P)-dependent dehydrogenase (short-subunit alcohol dehydrogenase family)
LQIAGRTFVVTGGKSGLGAATCAMIEREGGRAVVADLPEHDVTDEASIARLVDGLEELHGLVNCAGIGGGARVVSRDGELYPLEQFERIVRVNLVGTFNCIRHAARKMGANEPDENGERGVIVNTASVAAFDGQIGQVAYSASKGGVVGMTLPVARDLASFGIRVATIAPGIMDTPMLGALRDDIRASLEEQVPHPKRLGLPDEYALLVKAIVENPYLNAEVIRLDGGIRMAPR